MNELTPVLIAIGSNIERERNLPEAVRTLDEHPCLNLRAVSPIYESFPVGGNPGQPSYFNAAVLIETGLGPTLLKETLQAIERNLGRIRTADKYASRTIDLDIALYGELVLDLDGRHIPDPDIVAFPHVALPLADLAPDWLHPELGVTLERIAIDLQFSEKEIRKL